jgi:manganese transport protein
VQTRKYELNAAGKRQAIKFATIDSTLALMFALFINAAILIVSAATFYTRGPHNVAEIQDAYQLFNRTLGVPIASAVFAIALLASGQNSTLTGTLAGQIVMEGFLNIRIRPDSVRTFSTTGFRALSKIEVPPGKYELQIGAREAGGGYLPPK